MDYVLLLVAAYIYIMALMKLTSPRQHTHPIKTLLAGLACFMISVSIMSFALCLHRVFDFKNPTVSIVKYEHQIKIPSGSVMVSAGIFQPMYVVTMEASIPYCYMAINKQTIVYLDTDPVRMKATILETLQGIHAFNNLDPSKIDFSDLNSVEVK